MESAASSKMEDAEINANSIYFRPSSVLLFCLEFVLGVYVGNKGCLNSHHLRYNYLYHKEAYIQMSPLPL